MLSERSSVMEDRLSGTMEELKKRNSDLEVLEEQIKEKARNLDQFELQTEENSERIRKLKLELDAASFEFERAARRNKTHEDQSYQESGIQELELRAQEVEQRAENAERAVKSLGIRVEDLIEEYEREKSNNENLKTSIDAILSGLETV